MVENGVDPTTYHHARTQKTFQKDICNKGHVQRLKDNVWELVLPPCRAWGSNSGHQPWRQVPFPTELPHQPSTEAAQVFLPTVAPCAASPPPSSTLHPQSTSLRLTLSPWQHPHMPVISSQTLMVVLCRRNLRVAPSRAHTLERCLNKTEIWQRAEKV